MDDELGSGASATPTAAFVPSGSSPRGLDQRLQSTSGEPAWDCGGECIFGGDVGEDRDCDQCWNNCVISPAGAA